MSLLPGFEPSVMIFEGQAFNHCAANFVKIMASRFRCWWKVLLWRTFRPLSASIETNWIKKSIFLKRRKRMEKFWLESNIVSGGSSGSSGSSGINERRYVRIDKSIILIEDFKLMSTVFRLIIFRDSIIWKRLELKVLQQLLLLFSHINWFITKLPAQRFSWLAFGCQTPMNLVWTVGEAVELTPRNPAVMGSIPAGSHAHSFSSFSVVHVQTGLLMRCNTTEFLPNESLAAQLWANQA